ncbi:hypothetical protein TSOC_014376, partial [Tetrabaena socialis]
VRAGALASEAASSFRTQLAVALAPVVLLSSIVGKDPDYAAVKRVFELVAPPTLVKLGSTLTIDYLRLAPAGVIRLVAPPMPSALGSDLLASSADYTDAVRAVSLRDITLAGPSIFAGGGGGFGLTVRNPVFVSGVDEDETFGGPDPLNPACGPPCAYNATTRTKFWGFVSALIRLESLLGGQGSPLLPLEGAGYRYLLRAVREDGTRVPLAQSAETPRRPIVVSFFLYGSEGQWELLLAPKAGTWTPGWYGGLLAAVVLASLAISGLLFLMLLARHRHMELLDALLPPSVVRDLQKSTTYGPRRVISADTPADLLLALTAQLLGGATPDLRDVLFIRTTVLRNMDIYAPLNLRSHIKSANLDADVVQSLMQQLGGSVTDASGSRDSLDGERGGGEGPTQRGRASVDPGGGSGWSAGVSRTNSVQQRRQLEEQQYGTLAGALSLILTPQPAIWLEPLTAPGGARRSVELPRPLAGLHGTLGAAAEAVPAGGGSAVPPTPRMVEKAASMLVPRAYTGRRSMSAESQPRLAPSALLSWMGTNRGGGGGGDDRSHTPLRRPLEAAPISAAAAAAAFVDAAPVLSGRATSSSSRLRLDPGQRPPGELRSQAARPHSCAMDPWPVSTDTAEGPAPELAVPSFSVPRLGSTAGTEVEGGHDADELAASASDAWDPAEAVPRKRSSVFALLMRRGSTPEKPPGVEGVASSGSSLTGGGRALRLALSRVASSRYAAAPPAELASPLQQDTTAAASAAAAAAARASMPPPRAIIEEVWRG